MRPAEAPVTEPEKSQRGVRPAFVLATAAWVVVVATGLTVYATTKPIYAIIEAELAGSHAGTRELAGIDAELWPYAGLLTLGMLTLAIACALGWQTFVTRRARFAATGAAGAAFLVMALHAIETFLLTSAGAGLGQAYGSDAYFAWASGIAAVKYVVLTPVVVMAPAAIIAAVGRVIAFLIRRRKPRAPRAPDDVILPPPVSSDEPGDLKRAIDDGRLDAMTRWRNAGQCPPGRGAAAVGFCVSGGGIRSACVSLGALQALREELLKARYLVSVSGGGYIAGAMQLALRKLPDGQAGRSAATPGDVFEPGSAEEDHVRRHSKYLADGANEWLVAAGVVLRGVLVSLTLIAAITLVAGLALSWAYQLVPVTDISDVASKGGFVADADKQLEFREPALWAILVLVGLAAVTWGSWLVTHSVTGRRHLWRLRASGALVLIALLLTSAVVLIPSMVRAAAWLVGKIPIDNGEEAAAGGAATGTLAYLGALLAMLWRHRTRTGNLVARVRALFSAQAESKSMLQAHAKGLTSRLVVWAVLLMLGVVSLFLLAWTIWAGWGWPWQVQVGVPLTLAVIALVLDQTWVSLHPFYRKRIASAFAVRRVRRPDNEVVARGYDFDEERTPLDKYGERAAGFPQVIFAAAANLSGSDRTPPGRRAVSFTMSHDYIGGPEIGFAKTGFLTKLVSQHLQKDLSVQAAVAISGAAIASAMGRRSLPYQTLFALSNVRLGTWLPNPTAAAMMADGTDWRTPCVPRVRRLSYLLREVLGVYPDDAPLVFVSDGGHYENLGLVELLRHGVKLAYCIDASADSPPFAATLAEAITLAREELGIRITLTDPRDLIPGGAPPLEPEDPLAALQGRLSNEAVITGTIVYPEVKQFDDGTEGTTGTLIFAKASLTAEMPYELLSYAVSDPVFPRNGTSDQWFDHGQFDAYHALGRYLGEQALIKRQSLGVPTVLVES
ncbi:MAG: hypothetical protein GEU86_01860 [Actinophytocola sp.]|nr:hypothetical protein [Actinophytocola sp.]